MENRPGEEAQLSFPLPRSLDTKIHLRLSIKAKVILLYLTTVAAEDVGKPVPLGSFVYALPDVSLVGSPSGHLLMKKSSEIQRKPAVVDDNIPCRGNTRVHDPAGQDSRKEDRHAGLCGQFDQLCQYWARRHCGRGDGGIQAGRHGSLSATRQGRSDDPGQRRRQQLKRRQGQSPTGGGVIKINNKHELDVSIGVVGKLFVESEAADVSRGG